MKKIKKTQQQIFNDIVTKAHKPYANDLYVLKRQETPRKVLELALSDPDVPQDKKRLYKAVLDSGHLDTPVSEPNLPVLQKVQEEIRRRTKLAVKKGLINKRILNKIKD